MSAGRSHGANAANISACLASQDNPGTLPSEGGTVLASTKVLHVLFGQFGFGSVSSNYITFVSSPLKTGETSCCGINLDVLLAT